MIELNRRKVLLFIVIIILMLTICVIFYGLLNGNGKSSNKKDDIKYSEFNGKHTYEENIDNFEVVEKFLSKNQQVFMIMKKNDQFKSNWKKYEVNGYYLFYDYYFEDVEYILDDYVNNFISALDKIGVDQIIGSYVDIDGESKNQIYSYYIFLKYKGSGEKYGYKLCLDKTCKIEDEYYEEKKHDSKKYSEIIKINDKWAIYYSNIPSL